MANVRGRLAPSPTGHVHLGNARTALVAWLCARAAGGTLVYRLEDLDGARSVDGLAQQGERDHAWLGLDWDECEGLGGPHSPYAQSRRTALYEVALRRLDAAGLVFPCTASRKDLREIASAPHRGDDAPAPPSPPRLRPDSLRDGWLDDVLAGRDTSSAVRFRVEPETTVFDDAVFGEHREDVAQTVGDFVLRRRDGVWAYQLAVVVDDLDMGVTQVVRGADLLDSTARQIRLCRALGGTAPEFAHIPLLRNERGEKLSKRDDGLRVSALRDRGADPAQVTGYLAWSLGLLDRPARRAPGELAAGFSLAAIRPRDFTLPADAVQRILEIR